MRTDMEKDAHEQHEDHIRRLFGALEVGLEGADFDSSHSGTPAEIDPATFNRMKIKMDGEEYTVSIFRSTKVPPALSRKAQNLYDEVCALGGVEWHVDWFAEHLAELVEADLVELGPARGPEGKWKRIVKKGEPVT